MVVNFTPSLGMALFDFVPVILFFIGSFIFGSFMKRHTKPFGFVMFVVGIAVANFAGFCKAIWKMLLATEKYAPMWMDDFQFLFLGIGLTLVFISVFTVVKRTKNSQKTMAVPALLFTVKGSNLFYILLTVVVASTIGYLSCLIIYAKRLDSRVSIVLYIVYGVVSIVMGGLSGSGGLESVNWIAQTANTIGLAALLIAHFHLNRKDLLMTGSEVKKTAA